MEALRWERNPWGQQILSGLHWDMLYVAIVAGVLFVIADMMIRRKWAPATNESDLARMTGADVNVPERVVRHPLASRLFHWTMALSMFALLGTSFLPILGIQFSWVTAHWISGLVLTGLVLFHIVHSTFWMDLKSMWITRRDIVDATNSVRRTLGKEAPEPGKPGKYPVENKLYHHATAIASLVVIGTGLLMMVRVDTPFWTRNPYLLSDQTWGIMYVAHGISAVLFVTMIVAHIYLAVRPEKRWLTRSMLLGWIRRQEYLEHHDPELWVLPENKGWKGTGTGMDRPDAPATHSSDNV